jgi:FkbM family methyltransferase
LQRARPDAMVGPVPFPLRAVAITLAVATWLGCGAAEHRDILGTEKKLYSQFDEELVIRDFFQDRRGGVFLDVGASQPVQNSTTYYLEKHLGWTGIGIDALVEHYMSWKMTRPQSEYLVYLVTDHSGTKETFYHAVESPLSSVQKDRVFDGRTLTATPVEVETTTLDKVLDDRGIEKIDFLSMDIEESEPPALAGFDIERFRPELVCIEASPSIREQLIAYFDAHGYERIDRYLEADPINWYFRPSR